MSKITGFWLFSVLGMASTTVQAADFRSTLKEGYDFIALLNLSSQYDSNIAQAADSQPQDESLIGIIEPAFRFGARGAKSTYEGSYTLHHEAYEYDTKDDHTDHHLDLSSEFRFNARNAAGLNAGYHKEQAVRTSINRADPNEDIGDRSHWTYVGGRYRLGADTARAQLEFAADREWRRYDNNLDTASDNRTKERDTDTADVTFYVRLAPKTRLLLEVRQRTFDYLSEQSKLDNEATTYYAGIAWEATAKTTGSIRYGQEDKEFDDNSAVDTSEPAWDASITWQPRSYSTIKLYTKRGAEEGSVRSDAIDTANTTVTWSHQWSQTFSSDLSYNLVKEEYQGRLFDGRKDDTSSVTGKIHFQASQGVKIGASYTFKSRDSTSPIEEFDRELVELSLTLIL